MKYEFGKCRNCVYREIERTELELLIGIDTSRMIYVSYCEEEYEELKKQLEMHVEYLDEYLNGNINVCYRNRDNCKIRLAMKKSKEYFNKMLAVTNCDQYDYIDKLNEIYLLKDKYLEYCRKL